MQIKTYEDACKLHLLDKVYQCRFKSIKDHDRPRVDMVHKKVERNHYGESYIYLYNEHNCDFASFSSVYDCNESVYFTTVEECLAWYKEQIGKAVMDNVKQSGKVNNLFDLTSLLVEYTSYHERINRDLEALLDEYMAVS